MSGGKLRGLRTLFTVGFGWGLVSPFPRLGGKKSCDSNWLESASSELQSEGQEGVKGVKGSAPAPPPLGDRDLFFLPAESFETGLSSPGRGWYIAKCK